MGNRVNLIIDQGADFYQEVYLSDDNDDPLIVNEANGNMFYTTAAQMRKSYQAINAVSFSTGLSNGLLTLTLTAKDTANIESGRYVYDVEMRNGPANTVTRVVEGIVTVKPEATKV